MHGSAHIANWYDRADNRVRNVCFCRYTQEDVVIYYRTKYRAFWRGDHRASYNRTGVKVKRMAVLTRNIRDAGVKCASKTRDRSRGQIEIYIAYLSAHTVYIYMYIYVGGGWESRFNTLIGAKTTTGFRACLRTASQMVRVQNTSEEFVRACTRGGREGGGGVIRSRVGRAPGVPVAPGTGRQKRLNVPICPVRSPEAIHPRLPFVRSRVSLPTGYTNDITVSPKLLPPPLAPPRLKQ